MPAGFDNCRKNGGRMITVTGPSKRYGLKKDEYRHVCVMKGEFHMGEMKTKKKN